MKTQTYNQSKDLKMIAAEISRQYAAGEGFNLDPLPRYLDRGPCRPLVEFQIGSHTARCIDTPDAVARLVARYRKASGRRFDSGGLGALRNRDRATARGTDFGALAVVEHETLPA